MNMNMFNGSFGSLQDHRYPRRLYDSLQDHGIPENPIPGRVYCPIFGLYLQK